MKKFHFFFIGCVLILSSACQEKEEIYSLNLIGTWERANIDIANGLEGVLSYTFKTYGTYSWQISYREPGASENIGYLLIWNGYFRSTSNQLTLMPQETFYTTEAAGSPPFSRKEDLEKHEFHPGQVDTYQFDISADGSEFMLFAQPVVGVGPASEDILFVKVK